jgi:hypothetical protein
MRNIRAAFRYMNCDVFRRESANRKNGYEQHRDASSSADFSFNLSTDNFVGVKPEFHGAQMSPPNLRITELCGGDYRLQVLRLQAGLGALLTYVIDVKWLVQNRSQGY